MSTPRVGFLGLGLMGRPMAERLAERGLLVAVWNRTPEKCAGLPPELVCAQPAEVAARASHLAIMVVDGRAIEAILEAGGLAAALRPEQIVLNFSTVGAVSAASLAARVAEQGASYLDVPVLGSIGPARSGELILFVGGAERVVEGARPVLEALGKSIHLLGPVGSASRMKLIANMLLARYVEALGEVMALTETFHLAPESVIEILQESALASPMWEKARMLLRDPPPLHFPLAHMAKDLRLLDEEIERAGLSLPAHEAVHAVFQEAVSSGLGKADYSALANWIRRRR